tara:strand:+ start:703 stop:816 length:114 start_codon:yes stop_codon:yes gene_type:complete
VTLDDRGESVWKEEKVSGEVSGLRSQGRVIAMENFLE